MITKIEVLQKDTSMSRWATNVVKFTDDKGHSWEGHCSHRQLAIHELTLKLIQQGANEDDLEKFGSLKYDEGSMDEADTHAG